MTATATELRCPRFNRKFGDLNLGDVELDLVSFITTPYIEFSCHACRARLRKEGQDVVQVWHKFDLTGECIETNVLSADTGPQTVPVPRSDR